MTPRWPERAYSMADPHSISKADSNLSGTFAVRASVHRTDAGFHERCEAVVVHLVRLRPVRRHADAHDLARDVRLGPVDHQWFAAIQARPADREMTDPNDRSASRPQRRRRRGPMVVPATRRRRSGPDRPRCRKVFSSTDAVVYSLMEASARIADQHKDAHVMRHITRVGRWGRRWRWGGVHRDGLIDHVLGP